MVWSTIITSFHHIFHLHCPTPLKKIHMELNASDSELSMQFSHVACQFLVNNLHFITYFTHTQGKDRQQLIKEPSLKYYHFLLVLVYLHLFEIAIYLWLGFIGDTTEFLFAFCCKIWWNSIFGVSNLMNKFNFFSVRGPQ